MNKEILFNESARTKILKGVNVTADAVCTTLGPRGTHVIFEDNGFSYPTITKDGVTVAQQIKLKDKFENMGVMLTREAAESTNRAAGDGTTGTVAILRAVVNEGNKYIVSGMNPILINKGMSKALDAALDELSGITRNIETREEKINIATISANNDKEIGEMIVDVIDEVGKDGVITVTTNNSQKTEVDYVNGTKLDSGFESSVFINNAKRLTVNIDNPVIIITSDRISQQNQLVPIIQKLLQAGKKDMVLFAESIDAQAMAFLMQNYLQGKFACVPVKLPSFGGYQKDIMYDFAKLVEATVVGAEEGRRLEDAEIDDTGTCEHIDIARDYTIITGGPGDITDRVDSIKAMIEGEKDSFRLEKLKSRLGKMIGKIANIKVGGASQTEQTEVRYRIEDALNATKTAIEHGIVEGAGCALLRCSDKIKLEPVSREFDAGVEIVKMALQAPFKKIISNGGENADAILGKVLESDLGYNSLTQKYENLFNAGIIDPKKVIENEIVNAIATAGILLTSSCAIALETEEK